MKFSIIIPVYNASVTITDTLNSCIIQHFKDFEIILVDDCSNDNSASLIQNFISKYKKEYTIRLIISKTNKGVAYSRNIAIQNASGRYIVLLDSDDTWHPLKLQILNQITAQYSDTVMFVNQYDVTEHKILETSHYPIEKISFWSLLFQNKAQGSSICFRRDCNERVNENFRYCEDMELALRISYRYDCRVIKLPLTKLRRPQLSEGGLSGDKWQMRKAEIKIYIQLYRINILFLPVIPFMVLFSLLKHLRKL